MTISTRKQSISKSRKQKTTKKKKLSVKDNSKKRMRGRPSTKQPVPPSILGANIERIRTSYGWSQQTLHRRAVVPQATISRIEKDPKENPTIETIQRIANSLGRTVAELIGEEGPSSAAKPNRLIPVVNDPHCKYWNDLSKNIPDKAISHLDGYFGTDPDAFYVVAHDPLMTGHIITNKSLLLIEPNKPIREGDLVLTRDRTSHMVVMKYHQTTKSQFILQRLDQQGTIIPFEIANKQQRYKISAITTSL